MKRYSDRVTPDNIDSDDDESEVDSVDNSNVQKAKVLGTKSKMCMPRIKYSGNKLAMQEFMILHVGTSRD